MFENVAAADLLGVVRGHDFDPHDDVMGAHRIDAIKACDLVIRAAQAEQARQIAALNDLRASQISLGRGDHSLSVIGELGMARNVSPSAAGNQYGFAVLQVRGPAEQLLAAYNALDQAARAAKAAGDHRTRGQVTSTG